MSSTIAGAGFIPSFIEVSAPGLGAEAELALVVHGILGSASNWRGFVRKLVETDPNAARLRWVLVDLRHHGASARGAVDEGGARPPPPDDLEGCADDLIRLTDHLGARVALTLGHSFGGKVVLAHAERLRAVGRELPRGVWFLDSSLSVEAPLAEEPSGDTPRPEASTGDQVMRVIGALRRIPLPIPSREALVAALREQGFSLSLSQWMTTNVEGSVADGYRWRFDLDGIERLIAAYFATDAWPIATAIAPLTRVRAVSGGRSDRLSGADLARLRAMAGVEVMTLEEAGHWLHVDDPEGLRGLFARAALEVLGGP